MFECKFCMIDIEQFIERARAMDGMSGFSRSIKRFIDVFVSAMGILLFSPFFLMIYLAIRMGDGGPAFFKQARVGKNGKEFDIYKFRSMRVDAEKEGVPQLYAKDDDRLTKVGRFIRDHHLDELPQLWNVLKGDMSLVGHRPERMYFIEKIVEVNPDYQLLYYLRPGVFSRATLYNGYTDTMEKMLERLRMDLEYLKNRTLLEDFKIIFLTVLSIFVGKKF